MALQKLVCNQVSCGLCGSCALMRGIAELPVISLLGCTHNGVKHTRRRCSHLNCCVLHSDVGRLLAAPIIMYPTC